MFSSTPFYHQSVRKNIVAFGSIFNNLYINRMDSNDDTVKTLKIPLSFSDKQNWLRRINERSSIDDTTRIMWTLPRMAFEITSMEYDATRKLSTLQKHVDIQTTDDDNKTMKRSYQRVPYKLGIELNIAAKSMEDILSIVEQILPYFTPFFTVTVNDIPDLNITHDLKITLESSSQDFNVSAGFEEDQYYIWTLNFNLPIYVYGPVADQKVITKTIVDFYIDGWDNGFFTNTKRVERITLEPNILTMNVAGLAGTLSSTATDNLISGTTTSFLTEMKVGSTFTMTGSSQELIVKEIITDTSLRITADASTNLSGVSSTRAAGTFTIGEHIFMMTNDEGKVVAENFEQATKFAVLERQYGSNSETFRIGGVSPFEMIEGEIWKGKQSGATAMLSSWDSNYTIESFGDAKRLNLETGNDE